jgi:NADPH:quinone reductase-like Zn-dependent oxidoreductase
MIGLRKPKKAMVKSLGADQVIDYTKGDFTRNDETYDILFDAVGKTSFPGCLRSLKKEGVYLQPVAPPALSIQMLWVGVTSSRTLIGGTATPRQRCVVHKQRNVMNAIPQTRPQRGEYGTFRYLQTREERRCRAQFDREHSRSIRSAILRPYVASVKTNSIF